MPGEVGRKLNHTQRRDMKAPCDIMIPKPIHDLHATREALKPILGWQEY